MLRCAVPRRPAPDSPLTGTPGIFLNKCRAIHARTRPVGAKRRGRCGLVVSSTRRRRRRGCGERAQFVARESRTYKTEKPPRRGGAGALENAGGGGAFPGLALGDSEPDRQAQRRRPEVGGELLRNQRALLLAHHHVATAQ